MGDILGSIFGTSTSTTQQTQPDAIAQAQNLERLNQLVNLFATGGLNQFAAENPGGIYNPSNFSTDISSIASNNMLANQGINTDNVISFDDYISRFAPVTGEYNDALSRLDNTTNRGLAGSEAEYNTVRGNALSRLDGGINRNYGDFNIGTELAGDTYNRASGDVGAAYQAAIARGDYDLARSLMTNTGYADRALDTNAGIFQGNLSLLDDVANSGIGTNESNYLRSLSIADSDANRSLGTQDFNRDRALQLGIGATGNYIDQIATPRLNAALALQGLESGGAVPAAIARATAETAMPYLQGIESAYSTNQANTLNALMGLKGELGGQNAQLDAQQIQALLAARASLGGQYAGLQSGVNTSLMGEQAASTESTASGNRALGGQNLGAQTQLGTTYQNNINQLAQALMANNITLEQAGISAESALGQSLMQVQTQLRTQQQQGITSLGNTYIPTAGSFSQSLPGAAAAISLLPGQMQAQNTANLTGLQGIADFPRQLREADYLRRQGLFSTAYTGIPFTPGSTTFGGSATGNIFDQLGGTIQSGLQGGGNIGG